MLISSITGINAQVIKNNEKFSKEITQVVGDLNKDSINDKVIVIQDTVNKKKPYRLQVYFGQSSGDFKLFISTDKAIIPHHKVRVCHDICGQRVQVGIRSHLACCKSLSALIFLFFRVILK